MVGPIKVQSINKFSTEIVGNGQVQVIRSSVDRDYHWGDVKTHPYIHLGSRDDQGDSDEANFRRTPVSERSTCRSTLCVSTSF